MRARLLLRWVLALGVFPFALAGRTFSVVAYNLENLFDADGVAVYDDYQPERYRPAHLRTKLRHTADVLARLGPNAGPDVILFQEVEVDQTPASSRHNYTKLLERYRHTTFEEMLARDPLPPDLADWPAEAWLVKALHDRGMTGYTVAIGTDQAAAQASGQTRAIKCVTFSRFPVRAVRQHPLRDARNIVEVELEVEGARFFVFNNHWKSGAGDPELEQVRLDNARVLRARLDEILADDPTADILVGGDFNGHYNQKQRYPAMARTALNDVLLSQGHELAIRQQVRSLYNLWYELPPSERGSDTYRGEWGTLQQMMISRGLYDRRGVQYEDNSFQVGRIAGLNADLAGAPRRWDAGGSGAGFS
ncbi:MAG TPA: endonuclease/exonuclease/phosphatase family protein, partial [Candidatus Synoicihabitans sp.]|nr:endonuclease/exonuclease/phosphatase family protein [Candidatus Synoicihabitans sp.]